MTHDQTVIEKLKALAADPAYDPDDYHTRKSNDSFKHRCDYCRTPYAPNGVCGYCRYHVKRLRTEAKA